MHEVNISVELYVVFIYCWIIWWLSFYDYKASDCKMTARTELVLTFTYANIVWRGLSKSTKKSFTTAGVKAYIWTRDLPTYRLVPFIVFMNSSEKQKYALSRRLLSLCANLIGLFIFYLLLLLLLLFYFFIFLRIPITFCTGDGCTRLFLDHVCPYVCRLFVCLLSIILYQRLKHRSFFFFWYVMRESHCKLCSQSDL